MNNTSLKHLSIHEKQSIASAWFMSLRDQICQEFEKIEKEFGSDPKFERKPWDRAAGGGGEMSIMHGKVFEKVGVNISTVYGDFPVNFAIEIPGTEASSSFWASGISLVAHMASPRVPSVHMNTRMVCTEKLWFGGGADLTPTIEFEEDNRDFHMAFKNACDKFDPSFYPKFKKECDEYFFIKHRNESRGIGGIFYDYFNTGDWQQDYVYTQEVGLAFLQVFPQLVRRRMYEAFSHEEKEKQLIKRGRYAEFNLVYDRGTKFGFMTGGNTEAILMSLPPVAKW
jgi:coproporphyrinogen III oxidase